MSPIRKLAVNILTLVERWASPGSKEWAEASARELEWIDSDWRALEWAIGSLRVVLDRRNPPDASGVKPAKPGLMEISIWLFYLDALLWCAAKIFTSMGWQKLGWALLLLGCGYWAACSVFEWLQERWQPCTSDPEAYRLFLRAGLERKLSRYRTPRRWFPTLAKLSCTVGYMLIGPVHVWDYIAGLVWLLLQSDTPAALQVRIGRMDTLIVQAHHAKLTPSVKNLHSDHWGQRQS